MKSLVARSSCHVHERARQLAAHWAKPEGSPFDLDRPWESVIHAVALDLVLGPAAGEACA